MVGSLGWQELVLVLAIVALIAGGSRVADVGGALGRGVREFRRGVREEPSSEAEPEADEAEPAHD
jgi:sec-independent protein translocase protein TatA